MQQYDKLTDKSVAVRERIKGDITCQPINIGNTTCDMLRVLKNQ